ncbi:MAG TPA: fumarylacetoacetate hydrolase family protein [Steroidobacteraceae bacterium]|jgi:2-keto-4-pentenoate hydratase/2-oxohepta-3-ene-1,7-dioic acid hydratase in catechol pathway
MKLLNFRTRGRDSYGVLTSRGIADLGARLHAEATDVLSLVRVGALASARAVAETDVADFGIEDVEILSPAGRHTRYFCIGVNYPERNEEYKDGAERPRYPSVFMRTHTSFCAHGQPIVRPRESEQLDYEGEIVVVMGKGGRRIPQDQAMLHVMGYSCANEGSVRDWLRHAKFNVTQGKNFDRSGALGPCLVTAEEVGGAPLRVTTRVNGEVRQSDTSDRMIFPIAYLIGYLSTFCSLEPGDVILTGTPSGAGARFDPPRWLKPGDVVEVEVSRVGLLRNTVVTDDE